MDKEDVWQRFYRYASYFYMSRMTNAGKDRVNLSVVNLSRLLIKLNSRDDVFKWASPHRGGTRKVAK